MAMSAITSMIAFLMRANVNVRHYEYDSISHAG